jgi:hypothetical protein
MAKTTTGKKPKTNKNNERPKFIIDFTKEIKSKVKNHYAKEEKEKIKQKWHKRITTGLTIILTIATCYYAITARDTEERQLRAYVQVQLCKVDPLIIGKPNNLQFQVINYGQTPASKIQVFMGGDFGFSDCENTSTLFPGKDNAVIVDSSGIAFNVDQWTQMQQGKFKPIIKVHVIYKDIFGKTRNTRSGYIFDSSLDQFVPLPSENWFD